MNFNLTSEYVPTGDQPEAIRQLSDGIIEGEESSILEGTGLTLSGSGLLSGTPATVGYFEFPARAQDNPGSQDQKQFDLQIIRPYVCGDANGDTAINIGDAVYLVSYIFKFTAPPRFIDAGDANCDGSVNIADVVYLTNYVFGSGNPPCCFP